MKNHNRQPVPDLEECRNKIIHLLNEYNCDLISADEWYNVLLQDCDTLETIGFKRSKYGE